MKDVENEPSLVGLRNSITILRWTLASMSHCAQIYGPAFSHFLTVCVSPLRCHPIFIYATFISSYLVNLGSTKPATYNLPSIYIILIVSLVLSIKLTISSILRTQACLIFTTVNVKHRRVGDR